jgi:hypothetical protein
MTADQIKEAAILAVCAMDDNARSAFIAAYEAQNNTATNAMSIGYAFEGASRQIRLASMSLENSKTMDGLVKLVCNILVEDFA